MTGKRTENAIVLILIEISNQRGRSMRFLALVASFVATLTLAVASKVRRVTRAPGAQGEKGDKGDKGEKGRSRPRCRRRSGHEEEVKNPADVNLPDWFPHGPSTSPGSRW